MTTKRRGFRFDPAARRLSKSRRPDLWLAPLVALGCFVEIISFTPRVFVPVDRPKVLEAVLRRHPVQTVLEDAAA